MFPSAMYLVKSYFFLITFGIYSTMNISVTDAQNDTLLGASHLKFLCEYACWIKDLCIGLDCIPPPPPLKPETTTTLQPTTMSFENKLENLVNQSSILNESTTLDDLVHLANKLYTLSSRRSSPKDVVKIIDKILEVDSILQDGENRPQAVNTSAIIIGALDNQITKTFAKESNFTVANNNNIVLKAVTFDKNFLTNDLQFSASEDNLTLGFADTESTNPLVSVSIPVDILTAERDQSTNIRQISFVVFHRSGLFFLDDDTNTNNSNRQTTIWRSVIRVNVEQIDTEKPLDNNVTYNFNNVKMDKTCFKARCSYSDAISNVLREGCVTSDRGNGDVSCSCNRLGHVALLLDPVQNNKLGSQHILALHFLSIILFGLSAILLTFILLVYLSNRLIRQRAQYKVLICLFFSLAAFDVLYIVSNFSSSSPVLCKVIGVALHYFLLASVMWMGGEVFTLYMNVVPKSIFDPNNQVFVKKVACVCFLLPIVPVIAGAVYVFKMECVNNEYQCFMLSGVIFYCTLVAPVSLILFFNVVLFVRILSTLFTQSGSSNISKMKRLHRLTRHVLTIFIISGVTWCLAFFSLNFDGSVAFNYMFTIFNGFQGIVIFILFFVSNKEVKKKLSKNRVVRSIRYGFRPPIKSNTDSNLQHFKQNQQISEDPSYTVGESATRAVSF